ncbi:MAG: hypothetical protein K2J13_03630 [Clostridia bacterium]|nr:hypothetical protein [Clostridia bacterium]
MPVVIAIVVFVAIGIASTFAQEAKRKKKQAENEAAMRKFDEKQELKKYVEPKPSATTAVQRSQTARPQPAPTQSAQERQAARLQQLQKLESEIQSIGHHDDEHCAVEHEKKDTYRVEKVPVMNSIGGQSTEGCAEHYNVRYVKIEENVEQKRELTDLQKVIVYGEIINHPAFKKTYRR